ncbi:MAG: dipeptide ABC transporter ATP-binding protein [Desulfococcaceae bacterium]
MSEPAILQVRDLAVGFAGEEGLLRAVDGVSFDLPRGATLGLVGESGCGKSVTALSIMRLLPKPAGQILGGEVRFGGENLPALPAEAMSRIRGRRIAMIFQEPMTALNPVHRIGRQIGEVFRLHFPKMGETEIRSESLSLLHRVGIPEPEQRLREYPHQISGGMRQRVMIAMALACKPEILIADEPTTALDVTIQGQILALVRELQAETGMSVIFITHDLGVVAQLCDRIVVMYAGRIAEIAPAEALFANPRHPYTRGLLRSIPRLETPRKIRLDTIPGSVPALNEFPEGCRFRNRCPHAQRICETDPPLNDAGPEHFAACHFSNALPEFSVAAAEGKRFPVADGGRDEVVLAVENLKMHFPVRGGIFLRQVGTVHAVDGVSLRIPKGRTLGLVGESGCGKTTAGRCIVRLYDPTDGEIRFEGQSLTGLSGAALRAVRRNVQMIFQDPFESLNSRMTVGEILAEPFEIHGIGTPGDRRERVLALLERAGLQRAVADRFPHEFSGGQRQRVGIARAIALNPRLIVCDEPVSALDVSIQSQILNLLLELQAEMGLTYLFISHDLAVVKHISDEVAVMYLGKIVEITEANHIYDGPVHPYTQALLAAIPVPDPTRRGKLEALSGDVPSPVHTPSGCRFRTRCPIAVDHCAEEEPPLRPVPGTVGEEHLVACHRAEAVVNGEVAVVEGTKTT